MPLQCRKKRHYNDTIFQLKQHVSWENGPDSHFGMTQKLKYKIIVAQDIVGVKWKRKLYIVCERMLWKEKIFESDKSITFSMEVFFRSYGNIKKKNISGRCGESDTNFWMCQRSEPLRFFRRKWKTMKSLKSVWKIGELHQNSIFVWYTVVQIAEVLLWQRQFWL